MAGKSEILQLIQSGVVKSVDDLKKLLNYGSQTAPALIDDVAEEAGPLATRASRDIVPVTDKVIGAAGGSKPIQSAGNIIEGEIVVPRVSNMDAATDLVTQNPKTAAAIGAGTVATVGTGMMGGGDKLPPIPSEIQAKNAGIPSEASAAIPVDQTVPSPITPARRALGVDAVDQIEAAANEPSPAPNDPDFVKMLQDAQETSKYRTAGANFLRGAEQAGAGLSRTKAEYGGSDAALKQAGKPLEDVKATIGAHKEQMSFDKAKDEANDEKALSDPNSEISKTTREQLAKYGIHVKTAKEAKQMNPQIFNLLLQDRAAANAKTVAGITAGAAGIKAEKDLNEKQRNFVSKLRKESQTGQHAKMYGSYLKSRAMVPALEKFSKNPSGYTDYATLMSGLKSFQLDDTAVREAEVKMGINAASMLDKARNAVQSAIDGDKLQPHQREDIINTIKILSDASKSAYMDSIKGILNHADDNGISHNLILSGSLSDEEKKEDKSPESQSLTTGSYTAPQEKAIELVMTKNKVDRNTAIGALKKAKKL